MSNLLARFAIIVTAGALLAGCGGGGSTSSGAPTPPQPTPTPTAAPSGQPTATPTPTAKPSATPLPTPTPSAKPSTTPVPTPTPTVKPTATPAPTPTPAPGQLTTSTSALNFTSAASQTFTAAETSYSGTFSATIDDPTIATVTQSGNTFTVTPKAAGTATITVHDANGQTHAVSVTVTLSNGSLT